MYLIASTYSRGFAAGTLKTEYGSAECVKNVYNECCKEVLIMKRAYPTFIAKSGDDYLVCVPDMEIYTEGSSIVDAIEMARDAIGLMGVNMEDLDQVIPEASDIEAAAIKANTDIFDYSTGVATLVDVDFSEYRRKMDNKMVRRNVTLPSWMNYEAEKLGLNVSKVLQEALAERIRA